MIDFTTIGIPASLITSLERMGIQTPTPIQAETIPFALQGLDILASAQTGTGKTVAFAIPLIMKLVNNPNSVAVILTPTRELAAQVNKTLQILTHSFRLRTALLIGGEPMFKQLRQLKARPTIIVGTPGRINDHLTRGTLRIDNASMLVIDEADRMLDMGFGIQLEEIMKFLPAKRQTLMFSATLPPNIEKISDKYLTQPKRVSMGSNTMPIDKIKQDVVHTKAADKFSQLLKELEQRQGSIIIFVKTKRSADVIARELKMEGHSTEAIHGDLHQRKRDKVILSFRQQQNRILVATDVAARGLDIPHVMHVINYDLPQCPEDYIHRIGRTARAGAEGSALCIVSPEDGFKWRCIVKMMNPDAKMPHTPNNNHGQPRPQSKFNKTRFKRKPGFVKKR